jgi:predicted PurR-regulated permease PerM
MKPIPENPGQSGPSSGGSDAPWWREWWKVIATGVLILFLGVGLLTGAYMVLRPLVLVVLGIAIAAALAPIIHQLERWIPRVAAVLLVYAIILAVIVALGALAVPGLLTQFEQFIDQLPEYVERVQRFARQYNFIGEDENLDQLTSDFRLFTSDLITAPVTLFARFLDIVLVFVISMYALLTAPQAERFMLSFIPRRHDDDVLSVVLDVLRAAGGFVRGELINMTIVGVATYIGLIVIGVRFPLVLSGLAGLLEVIPIVGPIVAGLIIAGIALLQSPATAVIVLIFQIVLQQVEGNFLVPNIMGAETRVPPIIVLIAILFGGAIGGVLGALVAVPLAAMVSVLVRRVIAPWIRRQTHAAYQPIPTEVSE